MILYVNENNEVKDVDTTTDEKLIALTVNEDDRTFEGYSVVKICCYMVEVKGGYITMHTPYVDSRIIDQLDKIGKENEALKQTNAATQAQLDYVTMMSDIDI